MDVASAAERATPGDTIVVRGGRYVLKAQLKLHTTLEVAFQWRPTTLKC